MTIEEFDKQVELRRRISKYDDILRRFETLDKKNFIGVGVVWRGTVSGSRLDDSVDDEVVVEKFKEIIRERRDELIKEFEK